MRCSRLVARFFTHPRARPPADVLLAQGAARWVRLSSSMNRARAFPFLKQRLKAAGPSCRRISRHPRLDAPDVAGDAGLATMRPEGPMADVAESTCPCGVQEPDRSASAVVLRRGVRRCRVSQLRRPRAPRTPQEDFEWNWLIATGCSRRYRA